MIDFAQTTLKEFLLKPFHRFLPRIPHRTPDSQTQVDQECAQLELWQLTLSPYCMRVQRTLWELRLDHLPLITLDGDRKLKKKLRDEGGEFQVPCLRIVDSSGKVSWMYESLEINRYLKERFAR